MDESLSRWLSVREQADAEARSETLTQRITDAMPATGPVRVLDMATGAGSNIRYLLERLPARQHWLAVDRSAVLLTDLRERTASWAKGRGHQVETSDRGLNIRGASLECNIETREMNLGTLDDAAIFDGRHLVTASALLDLVSAQWLQSLAAQCRHAGAAALFTITYNGQSSCTPAEPEDDEVRVLLNAHQKNDKGLGGPAAGPAAVECAVQSFAEAGYRVAHEPSNWIIGPDKDELQRILIDGWAQAAIELAPDRRTQIEEWHTRRLAHVDAGRSQLIVGHEDLAAWLPGRGGL